MTSEAERGWREVIDGSLAAQKAAITSGTPLTVVSAGAGTGKTETLAKRTAWLLASDPECSVEQILVLTFTEKAAQEMRQRIEGMLKSWLAAYPKELAHLKKCVDRIEDAQISTIHSFAMKMIRESGLALDLDPDAAIIPTPNETIWWETFANALDSFDISQLLPLLKKDGWDARAAQLFSDDDLRSLVTDKGFNGPQVLAQAAKDAAAKLGSCGQTPLQLWDHDDTNLMRDIENSGTVFKEIWDTWLTDVFPNLSSGFRDNPVNSLEALRGVLLNFSQCDYSEENERNFAGSLVGGVLKKIPPKSKQKDEIESLLGTGMKKWRDDMLKRLQLAAMPDKREVRYAALLNKVCALGWHCWDELRRQSGLMSQDDLITNAVKVLEANEDYGLQFRHILIDEFQDTDDMQDRMLKYLWKKGVNTLFVVGDLKQSIYRFRHAKPENFQRYIIDAQNCTDGSCSYVSLDRSFRTRNQLLERFNTLFEDIWQGGYIEKDKKMKYEEICGPDETDAEWWKVRCGAASEPVIETIVAAAGSGLSSDDAGATPQGKENANFVRYRLFRGLAERMAALRAGGMKVWNKKALGAVLRERADAAKKGEKLCGWDELSDRIFTPAAWKDFSILVPSRKAYQPIETAFSEVGVPYVLCTSKDYYSRNEVTDVINLLTLLAEPDSALSLAGWLVSPFSGVAPQEAESLMNEAYPQRGRRKPLPLKQTVLKNRPDVMKELEDLRKTARLRGVAAVIAEISKSQYYLLSFESEKRARVTANLAYLAQLADEYEASQGRSLIGCADYMSSAVSLAEQQEEPDVTDEDEDAVNVLTIHASKGLEYPVVAVTGAESGTAAPKGICASERYGMVDRELPDFMLDKDEKKAETVRFAHYADTEQKALLAEKQRLWYVAATRARDKLMICGEMSCTKGGPKPPDEESLLAHVLELLDKNNDFCSVDYLEREDGRHGSHAAPAAAHEKVRPLDLTIVSPAKLGRFSASAYAMISWCPVAYRIAFRQGRNMQWALKAGEDIGGSEFGSLAHWVLSRWDFRADSLGRWLPEKIEGRKFWMPFEIRQEFEKDDARAEIRGMLAGLAATETGRKLAGLAAKDALMRETPFRVQDGDLLLVGAVDAMWNEGSTLNILDWKTTAEDRAPHEYYAGQIEFYSYAAWRYNQSKKNDISVAAGIDYLRTPDTEHVMRQFTKEDLEAAGESIRRAAEVALSGNFAEQTDKCEKCPWRKDCGK